jgi:hypothetical protein
MKQMSFDEKSSAKLPSTNDYTENNLVEIIYDPEKGLIINRNTKVSPFSKKSRARFFSTTTNFEIRKRSVHIDYRVLDDTLSDELLPAEFTAADWKRVMYPKKNPV